jgi:DNA-directed RNA polymerase specialized sigma24 family protein
MHDAAPGQTSKGPNSQDLSRLLLRLDGDELRAWKRYEAIRLRLARYFEWNHCASSEDLADQVLDRVAAKLDTEEIREVDKYCFGVARFVCLETRRKMRRETHSEDLPGGADSLPDAHNQPAEIVARIDDERRLDCLKQSLARLVPRDRELVIQYYSAEGENNADFRRRIAESLGIMIGGLRVRTNRLREQLEELVSRCLESRRQELIHQNKRFSL